MPRENAQVDHHVKVSVWESRMALQGLTVHAEWVLIVLSVASLAVHFSTVRLYSDIDVTFLIWPNSTV